jgi:DNA-binding MarR family transcriptional regulator
MLAQPTTQTEIAEQLNVDQSAISRDVRVSRDCRSNLFLI